MSLRLPVEPWEESSRCPSDSSLKGPSRGGGCHQEHLSFRGPGLVNRALHLGRWPGFIMEDGAESTLGLSVYLPLGEAAEVEGKE